MENIKYIITDYLDEDSVSYQELIIKPKENDYEIFLKNKGKEINVSNFFKLSTNLDTIIEGLKKEGLSDEENENSFGLIADNLKSHGFNLGYGFKDENGNFFSVETVGRDFYNLNHIFIIDNEKYEIEHSGAITVEVLEELKEIQLNLKNEMEGLKI